MKHLMVVGSTVIEYEDEAKWLVTRIGKRAQLHAAPNFDSESIARAQALGYGGDTWMMSRDHEILHTMIAFLRTGEPSDTLRRVALGQSTNTDECRYEEQRVLDVQRRIRE